LNRKQAQTAKGWLHFDLFNNAPLTVDMTLNTAGAIEQTAGLV
jgi:hypothetical protein